jgi:NAD(P)-dependent dehydrogenase (short-subunit alcohol dehydrogenase family)
VIVGKLDGKVAVITGGSTGMALAGAKLFVEEGAHVFIQARRQEALDDAVKLIGRNVTAVQGDAAELDDLDRLYDTVKREKGSIDVLWASAGMGEPAVLGEITEEQLHRAFWLNARAPCSPCHRQTGRTAAPPPFEHTPDYRGYPPQQPPVATGN